MGLGSMFLPFAKPALKRVIEGLLSLNGAELEAFRENLGHITAPVNRCSFKKIAQSLAPKIPRIPENDLIEAIAIVCQVVRDDEILEVVEDAAGVPRADRERLEVLLKTFNANRNLANIIAMDRFLDRGPRIEHLSWVCDLRTKYPDSSGGLEEPDDRRNEEEIRIALAIFRLKIDEWDWPIYFQLAENELEELIGNLQKARTQLQRLTKNER